MVLRLLIDAVHTDETRVVIADGNRIHDFDFITAAKKQLKGNIYLAKITRVEPSLQAAFVEYGGGKQGFLPFAEIHPDYYQIPTADRQRLLEEAEAAAEREEAAADHHSESQTTEHLHSEQPESTEMSLAETLSAQDSNLEQEHAAAPIAHEQETQPHTMDNPAVFSDVIPGDQLAGEAQPETHATAEHTETVASESAATHQDHQHETPEATESNEVETLASDEDAVRQSRSPSFFRRYKIQEVIKRNQIVLVQVIKEERGNKGCSLTTFISLAGRYCVLMPNSPKGGGISRKIMSGEDRKRLKEISAELKTARGMSAIIRTAGIDRTRAEIKRDYEYLVKLWESIREQTLSSTAPALIYEEGDLIKRTIRDLYTGDIEEIIVEGEESYNQAKEFLRLILPSHAPKVKLHQGSVPIFYAYNIEDQLASMYDPSVKLRSGGYIVLNPTEALISIDVNSGRSTGERNIEETATKTNLEAAAEIARQLRLRDLAGLIVIDFIDMMDSRNRRSVERALKDALRLDRAKIQIGRISPFGLLEMSRQRLRPSLSETSTMACPHCLGRGIIRSDASVAIQIIRAMEKEAASGLYSELKPTISPTVALHLLNVRRDALSSVEEKYGIRVNILTDHTLPQGEFRLEKIKGQAKRANQPVNQEPVSVTTDEVPPIEEGLSAEEAEILVSRESMNGSSSHDDRPNHRRGRRGGRGRHGGNNRPYNNDRPQHNEVATGAFPEGQQGEPAAEGLVEGQDNRPPRQPQDGQRNDRGGERGGRGRRPRRRDNRHGGQGHYRNHNDHENAVGGGSFAPAAAGSNTAQPNFEPPVRQSETRHYSPPSASSVPPLSQQASDDSKPKKGWWRRIVE